MNNCLLCGTEFTQCRSKTRKFCSQYCQVKHFSINNPDSRKETQRNYYLKYKERFAEKTMRRQKASQQQIAKEYRKESTSVYRDAKDSGLVVDHIVPLNHPLVCGLHVPWNLQLLSREANLAKSNAFEIT